MKTKYYGLSVGQTVNTKEGEMTIISFPEKVRQLNREDRNQRGDLRGRLICGKIKDRITRISISDVVKHPKGHFRIRGFKKHGEYKDVLKAKKEAVKLIVCGHKIKFIFEDKVKLFKSL